MPKPWNEEKNGPVKEFLHHFFQGQENERHANELEACFDLMQDADSLGSIMKFDLSDSTRLMLQKTVDYWQKESFVPEIITTQMPAMQLILALTEKYHALVMNPPYMGRSGMNDILTKYIHTFYSKGKWDLFATFMLIAIDRLHSCGKMAMINMHSWMFLDAFEDLRIYIVKNYQIDNMIHLGPNTFDELSGEVVQNTTFVITKNTPKTKGIYYRLSTGINCDDKRQMFIRQEQKYMDVHQSLFETIPSSPIAYWLSDDWFDLFKRNSVIDVATSKAGIVSGDDTYFVKYWHEVTLHDIAFEGKKVYAKYHTFQKGGTNRKYFGNNEFVFRLQDFWNEKFYNKSMRRGDEDSYFKKGIGWSYTGSTDNKAFRQIENCVCGTGTPTIYAKEDSDFLYLMGYLNSKITAFLLPILNPTLSLAPGYVARLPFVDTTNKENINQLAQDNISISKQDWDAHETSWDFQRNELTPDVPQNEITILQQGEISIE